VRYKGGGGSDRFPGMYSQAMTAAGLWTRMLVGDQPEKNEVMQKGLKLCIEQLPAWDPNRGIIDLYYWHYGALATNLSEEHRGVFHHALVEALTAHQRDDSELAGSWDPVGAWGWAGGRVYSTAMAALALATPVRFNPEFGLWGKDPARLKAWKKLSKLAKDKVPEIRAAALVAFD
jgi:hypothetical protein